MIALAAPLLGAMADRGGARLRLLAFFTLIGAAATAALYFVVGRATGSRPRSSIRSRESASGAASSSTTRCSSTSRSLREYDLVSAYGYALGYLRRRLAARCSTSAMVTRPRELRARGRRRGRARLVPDGWRLVAPVHDSVPALGARAEAGSGAAAGGRRRARRLARVSRDVARGAASTARSSGSCSRTGSTSTA